MTRRYVCKNCVHIGEALEEKQSSLLGFLLLLLFMLPFWWRKTMKKCAKCQSRSLARLDSAYGRTKMEEYYNSKIAEIASKKQQK
jgi:hypothetical protein